MADLQLSLIMGSNDRSRPVLDGSIKPDGIELTSTAAHPSEIFWRQLHFQEFHTSSWVRADSGIEKPGDLKGKRVGVPEYQQTAALWSRGVLKHEFGVEPEDIEWWMERTEERSHGGATGFT